MSVDPAEFVAGGEDAGTVDVRISYGIIDRFSEGLYSSPNKAFEELISNSYDAGAREVWVRIPDSLDSGEAALTVVDDGISMDLAGLQELWEVGVSHKREVDGEPPAGRPPIGKFGIGKLATYVLAEKLTYLCSVGETYLAVTMDYGRVEGGMADPSPMSLRVVRLAEGDARASIAHALGDAPLVERLFGEERPEAWTAAVLTDLKARGRGIQQGRLRWILRSALPVGDEFKLWFNGERLHSPKEDGVRDWEFVVGETDAGLESWPYADKVTADDEGRSGVELEAAGFVRGRAELFEHTLKRGKSEERGRSHGFFVRVRERLINLDDESFGVDVELHHGVLTRFRMELHADGLDAHLASPRESIQESPALEEVRGYLLSVFNRARAARTKKEEKTGADLLASAERIAAPPPALTTAPLRRILKRAVEGHDQRVGELLGVRGEEGESQAQEALDSGEALLREVIVEPLGHEKPLVTYDASRRAVVVNSDHPFVGNYLDEHGAAEPLRLVGATEFLTQIYMLDEDLSPALVHKILTRRDEFLRALVNIHPRSAVVVARQLRDSKEYEKELEDAVADALELLGYEVTRLSGNDDPDGLARSNLGAREIGGGATGYLLTYDSKSSKNDAIKAATAGTQTLRKHRNKYRADHTLLVAPGFQGADDEESSIAENCSEDKVTPISVEDLARLVEVFPFRSVTPESLRNLFELHLPRLTSQYVDTLADADAPPAPPVLEILELIRELSDRQDAVDVSALSTALRFEHEIDIAIQPLGVMLRGLAALAPKTVWLSEGKVALNASVDVVRKEMRASIAAVPEDVTVEYAASIGGEE
jgi:hypothetical protein